MKLHQGLARTNIPKSHHCGYFFRRHKQTAAQPLRLPPDGQRRLHHARDCEIKKQRQTKACRVVWMNDKAPDSRPGPHRHFESTGSVLRNYRPPPNLKFRPTLATLLRSRTSTLIGPIRVVFGTVLVPKS